MNLKLKRMYIGGFYAAAVLTLLFCVFLAHEAPPVFCEPAGSEGSQPSGDESGKWLTIESGHLLIEYENSVNLKTVARRLNKRGLISSGFFSSDDAFASTPENRVAQIADRLLRRSEEILDMYPPDLKLTIKIFNTESSLKEEYFRMFGAHRDYEAFYAHQYRTIYTSEYSISDSVIIHEMAHAVVDTYFSVKPPPKVSEVLATYVDVHLED